MLSMDALFGLPRKKAAGQSVREPIHGHLFFGDQASVDEFVSASASAKQTKTPKVSCVQTYNIICVIDCYCLHTMVTVLQ